MSKSRARESGAHGSTYTVAGKLVEGHSILQLLLNGAVTMSPAVPDANRMLHHLWSDCVAPSVAATSSGLFNVVLVERRWVRWGCCVELVLSDRLASTVT